MRAARGLPRAVVPLAALLALVACGGGGDGPTTPQVDSTPASVSLSSGAPIMLASGSTTTLSATVRNKSGAGISATVSWSSSDATVALVSAGAITAAKAGTATVTASAGSASASVSVTVTAGAASQLAMRTQPAGAVIGAALATQPVVEVRDAGGNLVTTATIGVTAAIASGGGTLGGTITVSAVGGVATFAGLAVSGAAGPRTLTFTATGLTAATSAEFSMTAPPTPVIVVDMASVTFTTVRGTNPAAAVVNISNTGAQPLVGITLDPVAYDANQPAGWLAATLSTPNAPAVATLAVNAGGLVEGTYHATLRINGPGAPNSPVPVSVTLTVVSAYTVTYGTPAEKVKVLDVGGTFAPTLSVLDGAGLAVPGVPLAYESRAASVVTVAADGRITARGGGDAWVVVTAALSTDSVFVIVPRSATAPLMRTNVTTWSTRLGDTLFVTVFLDTRGTTVGAASLAASLSLNAGSLTFFYAAPTGSPAPVVSLASTGVLRISVGAAAGMTGAIPVLSLKLVGRLPGTTGTLDLFALDVSAVDGSDLTALTSSTRLPFVFR